MALGGTITELQARMPITEVRLWMAYRKKYGPMNNVRKYDRPAALISSILSRIYGGKAKIADFLPFGQTEAEKLVNELVAELGPGVAIGKRR
jgi:hypothetical protein